MNIRVLTAISMLTVSVAINASTETIQKFNPPSVKDLNQESLTELCAYYVVEALLDGGFEVSESKGFVISKDIAKCEVVGTQKVLMLAGSLPRYDRKLITAYIVPSAGITNVISTLDISPKE